MQESMICELMFTFELASPQQQIGTDKRGKGCIRIVTMRLGYSIRMWRHSLVSPSDTDDEGRHQKQTIKGNGQRDDDWQHTPFGRPVFASIRPWSFRYLSYIYRTRRMPALRAALWMLRQQLWI